MKEIWGDQDKYDTYFKVEGWYLSGDLAYQDEEGYVFFSNRSEDVIHSSGERIGPSEIESKLIEHPAVAEAGAVGVPDPVRGEFVKAFITLRTGISESESLLAEIQWFAKNKLAAHTAPRESEVLEELPKTRISGKIDRKSTRLNSSHVA